MKSNYVKSLVWLFACLCAFTGSNKVMADSWTVTDTVLADGYYRILSDFYEDGKSLGAYEKAGIIYLGDAEGDYTGTKCLKITAASKYPTDQENWDVVWHIWAMNDGTGRYHMKNCSTTDADTYLFNNQQVCGQSEYLFAVGLEQDWITLHTKNWGSKSSSGDKWMIKMDRQDTCRPGWFFIEPASSMWRYRIGGSYRVKLNSNSANTSSATATTQVGAQWWAEPVDIEKYGKTLKWMQLNETISDVRGLHYQYTGDMSPGYLSTAASAEALDAAIQKAINIRDGIEGNGTDEEFDQVKADLLAAKAEADKYVIPLEDAYVFMQNHKYYNKTLFKYATINDDGRVRVTTGSGTCNMNQAKDNDNKGKPLTTREQYLYWLYNGDEFSTSFAKNKHSYAAYSSLTTDNFWGYDLTFDADRNDPTTMPDVYIWHIKKSPYDNGSYFVKNCGEESVNHDSTYWRCPRFRKSYGRSAWIQYPMCGTPHEGSGVTFQNVQGNWYRMYHVDNFFQVNMGNNEFNTANPANAMTYAVWELQGVPESRITPKFKLNEAITDAGGVFTCAIGTWPGMIKPELVEPLKVKLEAARELYATSNDDTAMQQMTQELNAEYEALMTMWREDSDAMYVPFKEGYYRFNCTSNNITMYNPTVRRVYDVFASDDNRLMWDLQDEYMPQTDEEGNEILDLEGNTIYVKNPDFRPNTPDRIWHVTKAGTAFNGKQGWNIQNVGTGKYIYTDGAQAGRITLSDEPECINIIENNSQAIFDDSSTNVWTSNQSRWDGWWCIFSGNQESYPWHMVSHGSGKPTTQTQDLENYFNMYTIHYALQPIEGDELAKVLEEAAPRQNQQNVTDYIKNAEVALAKTVTYDVDLTKPLITDAGYVEDGMEVKVTDAEGNVIRTWDDSEDSTKTVYYDPTKSQIWMNHQHLRIEEGGILNNLIDNDLSTFCHSRYDTDAGPAPTEKFNAIIVDLKENPQQNICFMVGARGNSTIKYGPIGKRPITYGVTDYGWNYRPVEMTVYAANDTLQGWNRLSTVRFAQIQDERITVSPAICGDQPYRFFRFEMNKNHAGSNYLGRAHFAPAEFNVYAATYNKNKSAKEYNTAVGLAAMNLQILYTQALQHQKDTTSTVEFNTEFKAAIDALNAVNIDSTVLEARLYDARTLCDSAYVEDDAEKQQYGDVTSGDKAEFLAAIAAAEAAISADQPTNESLQAAYDALNEAYFKFNKARKTFKTDEWFYMISTEAQGYCMVDRPAWRSNNMVYACGQTPQPAAQEHKMSGAPENFSHIRWGKYTDFTDFNANYQFPKSLDSTTINPDNIEDWRARGRWVDYNGGNYGSDEPYNPFNMWRIVQLEDSVYAFQNRATGLYIGRRVDNTNGSSNFVTQSVEPLKCQVNLIGRNQYEIIGFDEANRYFASEASVADYLGQLPKPKYETDVPFHSQGSDFHMVWWGTTTERGWNTGSAYTFTPLEAMDVVDDEDLYLFYGTGVKNNAVQILSFPFAVDFDEIAVNEGYDMTTYTLKGMNKENVPGPGADTIPGVPDDILANLVLTPKTQFEAGEPIVAIIGDPSAYTGDSCTFLMPAPKEYSRESKKVNGLVASLNGDSIGTYGFAYFANGAMKISSNTKKKVFIAGGTGYIHFGEVLDNVQADEAAGEVTVTAEGTLNGIKLVKQAKPSEIVNVVSADGKVVRKGVKAADATKGLAKGVYVVGNKKVFVR